MTGGLLLQVILAARNNEGLFVSLPARLVNVFSFFTIQSNVIVAITTGLLALNLHRGSTSFRALRLTGIVAIAITGIVFHIALANLHELTGFEALADLILHTLSPVLVVLGWILFGPRGQMGRSLVSLALIFPMTWLLYALLRGAIVKDRFGNDYYPYPFLNAAKLGYPSVFVAIMVVAVLFFAVSFGAVALDKHLPGVVAD
ncbi:MAG: Pr6Pr family membrane protein [Actinomycetota bacterium]